MNEDTDNRSPAERTLDMAYAQALSELTTNQPLPEWIRIMLGEATPPAATHCNSCGQRLRKKQRPEFHNLKVVK